MWARGLQTPGDPRFGCARCHSSLVTVFFWCTSTNVPRLLPTTTSGRPSPLMSPATTCVPTPDLVVDQVRHEIHLVPGPRVSLNQ